MIRATERYELLSSVDAINIDSKRRNPRCLVRQHLIGCAGEQGAFDEIALRDQAHTG